MLALLVTVVVFSCTFVGCNGRLDGGAKAGFFAVFAAVIGAVALFSWLLG